MQRMHSMMFGLIALFVLGGSLVLVSCRSDENTMAINGSNAAAQLGGTQCTCTTQTECGVANATLAFNASATRFALAAGNSVATGPTMR